MPDTLTKLARSQLMGRIRGAHTKPEVSVRRLAHSLGYRFRLHRRDLPGTPDLVFPSMRKVIFVHGCFWHRHPGCKSTTSPGTNVPFWEEKFAANVRRDRRNIAALQKDRWRCLVVWACETRQEKKLRTKLIRFLGPRATSRTR